MAYHEHRQIAPWLPAAALLLATAVAFPLPGPGNPTTSAPATEPVDLPTVIGRAGQLQRTGNSAASQPASAPEELDTFPPPAIGQYAVYTVSSGGGQGKCRQTVEAVGPGPADITVSEQMLVNNQAVGKPTMLHLPRFGPRWPAPMNSDARTISYAREQVELAGQRLDCIVLTTESRAAGVTRIERQWISPAVPITHLARLLVTTDGREVFRQELFEFGSAGR